MAVCPHILGFQLLLLGLGLPGFLPSLIAKAACLGELLPCPLQIGLGLLSLLRRGGFGTCSPGACLQDLTVTLVRTEATFNVGRGVAAVPTAFCVTRHHSLVKLDSLRADSKLARNDVGVVLCKLRSVSASEVKAALM